MGHERRVNRGGFGSVATGFLANTDYSGTISLGPTGDREQERGVGWGERSCR